MNRVTVNGKTINVSGKNISMVNGRVFVDGKEVTGDEPPPPVVNITVEGDVGELSLDEGYITVNGNVTGSVETASGDIKCGDVGQNAQTTSGDIKCGNVGGKVKTISGDISHR